MRGPRERTGSTLRPLYAITKRVRRKVNPYTWARVLLFKTIHVKYRHTANRRKELIDADQGQIDRRG